MTSTSKQLEHLLDKGLNYLAQVSESEMSQKTSAKQWSKKEILGHLIDSGINNLQRFTEIQFEAKPYRVRGYNQDALVKANNYQNIQTNDIAALWNTINKQILHLIQNQTEDTLNYKIELAPNNSSDLRFLIQDYVKHLDHHLKQIMS